MFQGSMALRQISHRTNYKTMKHTMKRGRERDAIGSISFKFQVSSLIFNQIRIIDLSFIQIFGIEYFDNKMINEVAFISCVYKCNVLPIHVPYDDEDLENFPPHIDIHTDLTLNALVCPHSNQTNDSI